MVSNAGTPRRQLWRVQLSDLEAATAGEALSPCIIVLGDVVDLGALDRLAASG